MHPATVEARRRRTRRTPAVVAVALAGTAVLGVGLARFGLRIWEGTPFPVADPAVTAQRLDQRTVQAYDALDLPQAKLDTEWTGGGRTAQAYGCEYRGLSHLGDQLSDSPPNVPGVVTVSTEWALKGVTEDAGQAALRRARAALRRQGWRVTTYTSRNHSISLEATPPHSDARVGLDTYPGGRLALSASAGCLRYPKGTPVDESGDVPLPPQRLPGRLRG
ncbi:hypothetical protein BFF78_16540 [Streptomyces fodineus]|uniref:Uncharacterized protein n=1 Tax=Streptomyces fodineus TaxID=1904616 RepID=A0A1D7YAU7_9ACTN|nr:hypothetical protein BFF78_16540 [Streptomyces fodineus]